MHSNQKKEPKQVRNQKPFIKRYVVVQPAVHGIVMIHLDAPFCVLEQQPKYRPVQQQLQMPELVGIQEAQAELAVIHWCDPVFHHGIHPEYSTQRLCCARVESTRPVFSPSARQNGQPRRDSRSAAFLRVMF